ncbi:MAG: hypothetical protein AMXMBFR60_04890 [Chloroflexota bacterium]
MLLPDVFLQRARAHPGGERRFLLHAFPHGMVEEIGHGRDYSIIGFGKKKDAYAVRRSQNMSGNPLPALYSAWDFP